MGRYFLALLIFLRLDKLNSPIRPTEPFGGLDQICLLFLRLSEI